MKGIVTLLTDFGSQDHYVAAMKGVLLSINPGLTLIDISHAVTPQNIQGAAYLLVSAFQYFPEGTLHLAVVDPGVGGERRGLAAASKRYLFVGPDNGLFDRVFALTPPLMVVSLENVEYQLPRPSATFHGRDIFAPAAGHLSLGLSLEELGTPFTYRMRLPARPVLTNQEELKGEIIHVDRFGNLISNIEIPSSQGQNYLEGLQIYLGTAKILSGPSTYEQAPPLRPFALVGSSGHLELAVRNGSAHEITGCGVGSPVVVRRLK
jgi:S-adenosylmethionine hydrolase